MSSTARGTTLPWDWYVSPDVLRREEELIFRGAWHYAGPLSWVAEPGERFPCRAGDAPVVVVRDRDGTLRAFLNVCRHRGSVIVKERGRRETLQCPYHAWTYGLDGALRSAPRVRAGGRASSAEELGLRPRPGRHVGAVRVRQRRPRGAAARRVAGRAAGALIEPRHGLVFRERVDVPSWPRTGRSPSRTTSSATTAPSPTRGSAPSSTSIRTPTARGRERRAQPVRATPRRRRRRRRLPVPPRLACAQGDRLPGRRPTSRSGRCGPSGRSGRPGSSTTSSALTCPTRRRGADRVRRPGRPRGP